MKRIYLLIPSLFMFTLLHADVKQEVFQLYKAKNYKKACNLSYQTFKNHQCFMRDEEFISLLAFSCLEADYIDRLASPSALLKRSSESRANSAYFATILMQKKLLYHALVDGYQLSAFKLPTTTYVLSKVFDAYAQLPANKTQQDSYIFQDPENKRITYKLYVSKNYEIKKMVIEEYYDKILKKRHKYW